MARFGGLRLSVAERKREVKAGIGEEWGRAQIIRGGADGSAGRRDGKGVSLVERESVGKEDRIGAKFRDEKSRIEAIQRDRGVGSKLYGGNEFLGEAADLRPWLVCDYQKVGTRIGVGRAWV
jgi:hypothetical protein